MDSTAGRFNALVKASFIALGADIFLVSLKSALAVITGSAVLSADAWHSAGDFAVSLTVLTSIIVNHKMQAKAWARNMEGLVALFISFILVLGGMKVVIGVFTGEASKYALSAGIPLVIAIAGISVAVAVAFIMFRYKRSIGLKHKSIAFIAESVHTSSDFFTSIGVWLTLLLGFFGIHIERLTAFIVGLIVMRIGVKLFIKLLGFFNLKV